MASVRTRPILFSAEMVRAILDGRKSQTRRMVKPQPTHDAGGVYWKTPHDMPGIEDLCPYGQPGDVLWCRETWSHGPGGKGFVYFADCPDGHHPPRWKPSIHMPRIASRITLLIKSVRVERLQAISEWECYAEGISKSKSEVPNPRAAYANLWDEINGPGSWAANPWVWVVGFERIEEETVKHERSGGA